MSVQFWWRKHRAQKRSSASHFHCACLQRQLLSMMDRPAAVASGSPSSDTRCLQPQRPLSTRCYHPAPSHMRWTCLTECWGAWAPSTATMSPSFVRDEDEGGRMSSTVAIVTLTLAAFAPPQQQAHHCSSSKRGVAPTTPNPSITIITNNHAYDKGLFSGFHCLS